MASLPVVVGKKTFGNTLWPHCVWTWLCFLSKRLVLIEYCPHQGTGNNRLNYRGWNIRLKPSEQWQGRIQLHFRWTWLRMWKIHWVLLVSLLLNWPLMTSDDLMNLTLATCDFTNHWLVTSDLGIGILRGFSFLTILICNHVDSVDYWSWVGSRVHSWRVAVECISCVG